MDERLHAELMLAGFCSTICLLALVYRCYFRPRIKTVGLQE